MATKAQYTAEHRKFAKQRLAELTTEGAVIGAQAALTLSVLQFVARDVWGSADLHFDGDCFQEHEWHVIMRGGAFHHTTRQHASGKTALEAVLAAAHLKLKDYKRFMKKKDYMHHWSQIDIWQCLADAYEAHLPVVRKMESDRRCKEFLKEGKELDFGAAKVEKPTEHAATPSTRRVKPLVKKDS